MEQPTVFFFSHQQSELRSSDYRDQGLAPVGTESSVVLDPLG